MTDKNIANEWAAGAKKGEGWTELTFNENKTCSATLVACSNQDADFEIHQDEDYQKRGEEVVVFKGTGISS